MPVFWHNIIRLREGKLLFFVNARYFGTGTIRHQDTSAPVRDISSLYLQTRQELKGWIKTIGMIGIFSGTDMIKIWNWFTAIGSFARKIQEKNTSAELSWCRNVSHRYRIVRVPNCLGAEMICFSIQPPYYSDPWPRLAHPSSFLLIRLFNNYWNIKVIN
jgi:hypothetical protein